LTRECCSPPQPLRSHLSLAFAAALVCHCRFANAIGSAAGERLDVILDVAGTRAGRAARRGARMLPLKFVLDGIRAMSPSQNQAGKATSATAKITDLVRLKYTLWRMP
jgi:hypothetical protein